MGLEPTQISPYAPETYVSTIPPLRLILIFNVPLFYNMKKNKNLYLLTKKSPFLYGLFLLLYIQVIHPRLLWKCCRSGYLHTSDPAVYFLCCPLTSLSIITCWLLQDQGLRIHLRRFCRLLKLFLH